MVSGTEPYMEDHWSAVAIGNQHFMVSSKDFTENQRILNCELEIKAKDMSTVVIWILQHDMYLFHFKGLFHIQIYQANKAIH